MEDLGKGDRQDHENYTFLLSRDNLNVKIYKEKR